jgi:hypothetical protein
MQDVNRPAHVEALAQPAGHRRPRVNSQPLRLVPRSQDVDGIGGHRGGQWHLGQQSAVRAPEVELAVGLPFTLETLLVDGAVVPATEQREIRERGRAAVRPVADVMALAEPHSTAREAATPVSMLQGPP